MSLMAFALSSNLVSVRDDHPRRIESRTFLTSATVSPGMAEVTFRGVGNDDLVLTGIIPSFDVGVFFFAVG